MVDLGSSIYRILNYLNSINELYKVITHRLTYDIFILDKNKEIESRYYKHKK
jgi:hypothetical protein